jgi:Protein of unknown function (DUF3054)
LRWQWPVIADVVCVLVFAIGGKGSHESSAPASVVLAIAWPYVLAAGLAHVWLVSRGAPTRRVWPEGAVVLTVTYVLGMLLRAASGRGLAPGFLIVAGVFLALTMVGWRGLAQLATRPRAGHTS